MYYIIYKITNQINSKFYIGSHKTINLDDNYMGSGKYLKKAQEKYGIENFKKDILFVFNTAEEMYAKEAEIVNEDFLATENTYNLKIGGFGGWDYVNKTQDEEYIKIRKKNGKNYNFKTRNDDRFLPKFGERNPLYGVKTKTNFSCNKDVQLRACISAQSEAAKRKRKDTLNCIKHQQGEKNSQFGTRWIHSLELKTSKRIKKEDDLPFGWFEGRKIKFI
jgi:hypothetical protein